MRIAQEQVLGFNFPGQVGTNGVHPGDGIEHSYEAGQVKEEEIILVASDGVWDNLNTGVLFDIITT